MSVKFKILVIDDEEDLRENLKYIFQMKGCDVHQAEDGVQGLNKLKTFTPDLIILDMNMPNMGGIEFYQKICTEDGTPKYPVFILTARSNMEGLFKDLKVEHFMAKPFDIEKLTHEVERIINKQKEDKTPSANPSQDNALLKNIYLIEDNPEESNKISVALLDAGYRVACAKSCLAAMELIKTDPPRLWLIKLGLPDINGEWISQCTKNMEKTSGVKCLLYEKRKKHQVISTRQQMNDKTGAVSVIDYETPADLIRAVDDSI
jgi:DNA-binding response OmpR family regulator